MVSNDLKDELNKLGIEVHFADDKEIEFKKDGELVKMKVSTIRRVFLNSLISHIDNVIDK